MKELATRIQDKISSYIKISLLYGFVEKEKQHRQQGNS